MIQVSSDYSIGVPVTTAQAVQRNSEAMLPLESLGLLVNLLSYPAKWELNKTELYKRFSKHGERAVKTAWNGLMDANYIIEFRYRSGRKWEYVYYFRKAPFMDEEKAEILKNAEEEYGEILGLRNEDLKMETAQRRGNQKNLLNKNSILNTNNQYIENIDEEKQPSLVRESSAIHNEENISLLISNFRELTKGDLTDRSFNAIVRKVVDKYNQGKVRSFRDYLATALANKIEELELRRLKMTVREELKVSKRERSQQRKQELEKQPIVKELPLYNWLEE